jgi:hypothetical protein
MNMSFLQIRLEEIPPTQFGTKLYPNLGNNHLNKRNVKFTKEK